MKKTVEQFVQQMQQGRKDHHHVLKEFSKMLDDQVCIASIRLSF